MLRVDAVDANLRLLPILQHVVQEGDDLLNEVETFNPFPLLSLTVLKGHRMHLKGDLVDPRKLVKDCHEAIEESLHSIAILLSNLFH